MIVRYLVILLRNTSKFLMLHVMKLNSVTKRGTHICWFIPRFFERILLGHSKSNLFTDEFMNWLISVVFQNGLFKAYEVCCSYS